MDESCTLSPTCTKLMDGKGVGQWGEGYDSWNSCPTHSHSAKGMNQTYDPLIGGPGCYQLN